MRLQAFFRGGDVQGLGRQDCSTLVPTMSTKIPPNTGIVTKMAFGPPYGRWIAGCITRCRAQGDKPKPDDIEPLIEAL
jgi:hypothetical protein